MGARKRRVWRFVVAVVIVVLLIGAAGGFGFKRYERPINAVEPQIASLTVATTKAPDIPWPGYGQAAIGAVGYGLLDSHGVQTAVPTASVAKVLTAVAVLKQKPIPTGETGPIITITAEDVASYQYYAANDGAYVPVQLGEQISEYQALQALLLPSSNNMAFTLARWSYGSLDAFLAAANSQVAPSLGLTHMHLADASGFDAGTAASAEDLVRLGLEAMKSPVLADIVSQKSATIPVAGAINNVNALLGSNGVVGIKTGNTDQAGGCYLFASKQKTVDGQDITVVGAIMAAPTLATAMHDSLPLITAIKDGFETRTVIHAGQTVATYSLPWGATATGIAQKDIALTIWKGTPVAVKTDTVAIKAGAASAAQVGTVTVTKGSDSISTPIVLDKAVAGPSLKWRIQH